MTAVLVALFLAWLGPAPAEQRSVAAARELLSKGSSQQAVEMLRQIVATNPQDADARLLLGTALALDGERSESIRQLLEVVRLRPDSATAYNALGMALSRFVETKSAREAFEKAIQLDPNLLDAHLNLALILAQTGEFGLAGAHLDRAIAMQGDTPAAARSYYLRAKIRGEQHDLERARADLDQAVRLRPDFAEAWSELGAARRALQDDAGALRALERAVQLKPEDNAAQFRLGSEYLHSRKPHQAVEHLREALRRDPDNRAALYNLQMALREDGRKEEARQVEARMAKLLRKSGRASGTSIQAAKLNDQGVDLEKAGNLLAALDSYRAALDLDPDRAGVRLNYGLALCRLGRWEEGIAEVREVVRSNPDNAEAIKALYIALEQQPKKLPPSGKTAPNGV